MVPFLELVAQDILSKFENNMHNICLVFPNRRSILYFNKYLSQKVQKPLWAPQCITISEFIQSYSTFQKADNLLLLYELHQVYCKIRSSNETFDSFYFWGEIMLSDFDDIDKYRVDAEMLFKNVAALKNINEQFSYLNEEQREVVVRFWGNYMESRQSQHHKEFSDIWSVMHQVYKTFKENLRSTDSAYEGMIYREVADSFTSNTIPEPEFEKIAFIGFNALNECEKCVFNYFQKKEQAFFYWDFEQEYLEPTHEAGFFVRKNLQNFPQAESFNSFADKTESAQIELFSVPSHVGQAKIVSSIVDRNMENPENVAILLSDENLLMPVLHGLPEEIKDINITMGYPVKNASISSLIDILGKLYTNSKKDENKILFYHKQVIDILTHPFILRSDPEKIHQLMLQVYKLNRIYVETSLIDINPLLANIFVRIENGKQLIDNIRIVLQSIAMQDDIKFAENPVGIEKEALASLYTALNKLSEIIEKIPNSLDLSFCFRILKKVISGLSIPFEGEPLKGIQVMGFLESRALDFETLIILGVNEGNLPKSQNTVSFIPYNLRKGFLLPTPEFKDAMYAYYFYRIIHRAKRACLVYSTASDDMSAAEVSRYVTQMMYNGKYNIKNKVQTFNIVPVSYPEIKITKTPEVLEKLLEFTTEKKSDKFISPSALSNYIECPVRFYLRHVEGIKEIEEVTTEIDPAVFGNVLHGAMKLIYKGYVGQDVTKEMLTKLLQDKNFIESQIKKALDEQFLHTGLKETTVLEGRNILIFRILYKYIQQTIKYDLNQTPFNIISLEEKILTEFEFQQAKKTLKLRIGGYIDRLDQTQNCIRIVDYKTGNPETNFRSIEELFKVEEGKKFKKEIFQTCLYSVLYEGNNVKPIVPHLYVLRSMFDRNYATSLTLDKAELSDIKVIKYEYSSGLLYLIEEIFNPELPFMQTPYPDLCTHCAYKMICNK